MFKRILTLLLALMLSAGAALAEGNNLCLVDGDYANPDGTYASSIAGANGWAYLIVNRIIGSSQPWLARWQPGMDAPEKMADLITPQQASSDGDWSPYVQKMFTDGSQVYGISQEGHVTLLVDQNGEAALRRQCKLDVSGLSTDYGDYQEYDIWGSVFAREGKLYLLSYRYSANGFQEYTLSVFDLSTGERLSSTEKTDLRLIAPYNDAQMLALVLPGGQEFDEQTGKPMPFSLSVVNLEGEMEQSLVTFDENDYLYQVPALCYDEGSQTVYYIQEAVVRGLSAQGGEPATYAYLPETSFSSDGNDLVVVGGEAAVTRNFDRVSVRQLDAQAASLGALTLAGVSGTDAHSAVIQEHPEIPLRLINDFYSDIEKIATAMISGDDAVDLMMLNYTYTPVERLIEKGYAADLSAMPSVMALVERMPAFLKDACLKDGKVYFLPASASGTTLGYRVEALEALGLTEDDLPKTYPELFDFCVNFEDNYGAQHPEVSLVSDVGFRETLMNLIVNQYIAYQLKTTGSIRFDTPLFRELISGLEAVDFSPWDPYDLYGSDVWNQSDVIDEFYEENRLGLLMMEGVSPSSFGSSNAYSRLILLSLDDGLEPIVPITSLEGFVLNPRSARADLAEKYLAAYLQNLPWHDNIMFFEDANDAVPNPYYEANLTFMEQTIEELEKQLAAAAPENRAELEDALQLNREYLETIENERYYLDEDSISRYRQSVEPYLYPLPQTPLTSSEESSNFNQLMRQYQDHAIDLDTYIQEMDRRIRLIQLEGL